MVCLPCLITRCAHGGFKFADGMVEVNTTGGGGGGGEYKTRLQRALTASLRFGAKSGSARTQRGAGKGADVECNRGACV